MFKSEWLTKDVGWKLFSLMLAVAIWLTVHKITGAPDFAAENNVHTASLTYNDLRITPVSATSDVHNYRFIPQTVDVTVSGSPEVMAVLQENQIRVVVDLTGVDASKGNQKCNVDVWTPSGVTVVKIDPAKVSVLVPPP